MRGMRIGGTALLLVGLALPVQAGDAKDTWAGGGGSLGWSSLFGGKDKAAKPAATDKPSGLPTVDEANKVRERELQAYIRRLKVCDRLQEIADRTNNEDLRRQAERMAQRTFAIYQQRTGAIAGDSKGFVSDEAALNKRLGANGSAVLQPAGGRSSGEGARAGVLRGNEP